MGGELQVRRKSKEIGSLTPHAFYRSKVGDRDLLEYIGTILGGSFDLRTYERGQAGGC